MMIGKAAPRTSGTPQLLPAFRWSCASGNKAGLLCALHTFGPSTAYRSWYPSWERNSTTRSSFFAVTMEMLGDLGLFAKRTFYEGSAGIPMILMGLPGDCCIEPGTCDDRLVGLQDVMPTLLGLAGINVPESCDGLSMTGERRREVLYGRFWRTTAPPDDA